MSYCPTSQTTIFVCGSSNVDPLTAPGSPAWTFWASLLVGKDCYSNVKMELMVCQMLFLGTIIYENKTPDKSCVIIRSFLRDPSKLPNYLLLRRGQPCQSTGSSLSPPSPLSLPPPPPHLQTWPTQDLMALRSLRSSEVTPPLGLIKAVLLLMNS